MIMSVGVYGVRYNILYRPHSAGDQQRCMQHDLQCTVNGTPNAKYW